MLDRKYFTIMISNCIKRDPSHNRVEGFYCPKRLETKFREQSDCGVKKSRAFAFLLLFQEGK